MSQTFFSALSILPGLSAPWRDWHALLESRAFELATPFLKPTGRIATAVHCPIGCGCAHEVTGAAHELLAVCVCDDSGGCPDIALSQSDIEVLEASPAQLGREIAKALHCRPLHAPTADRDVWQIGTWSAEGLPVLITFQAAPGRLAHSIAQCAARLRSRFILLAGDVALLDARSRELLAQTGSGVFGLGNILRMSTPGRFQPVRDPEDLFSSFTSEPADPDDGGIRKAFALIEKLEHESPGKPPGLATVFKLYCMDELTANQIARKCGCAKTTVIERLARLRKATGVEPSYFRRFSNAFERPNRT